MIDLGRRDRAGRRGRRRLWLAAVLLAAAGAADSVSAVSRTAIIQSITPDHMRGRMAAVYALVVTSGPRLGDIESGAVAGAAGRALLGHLGRPGLPGRRRRRARGLPGARALRRRAVDRRTRAQPGVGFAATMAATAHREPSARRARSSPTRRRFAVAVRTGFVARGLTYALIGAIAIALALGAGSRAQAPNQQGALSLVASAPLGSVALDRRSPSAWGPTRCGS